jgi:hypothetical protein
MEKEDVKSYIISVLKKHGVLKASLFGSYVRGEQTTVSDIDILVELEEDKSLLDLIRLEMELSQVLKRKVDVLTYGSLNSLIKDTILSEQELIYEKAT